MRKQFVLNILAAAQGSTRADHSPSYGDCVAFRKRPQCPQDSDPLARGVLALLVRCARSGVGNAFVRSNFTKLQMDLNLQKLL
jgi:hypothetical protein